MGDFHTTSMCRFMVATQAALRPLNAAPAATRHRRMHGDPEFEKFCYFLKHRSAAPAMGVPQIMAIAQKELSKLDFNVLSNYEKDSDLERFAQMLREKAKILQTIVDYHKIAKRN